MTLIEWLATGMSVLVLYIAITDWYVKRLRRARREQTWGADE